MRKARRSDSVGTPAACSSISARSPAISRAVPLSGRLLVLIAVLLIAAAAILRIRAAHNDLWLDEIWSLNLLQIVSSPLGVLTSLHYDNNHYLTTLWMFLLPGRGNWWGYRIPSVIGGIGTVVVGGLIGYRRSRVNAVILMVLTAFSYS